MKDLHKRESVSAGRVEYGERWDDALSRSHQPPELGSADSVRDHAVVCAPLAVLPTIRRLCDVLEAKGIRYCHWKSNVRLAATLAGFEDIDILVDRRDATAFHATLSELRFKLARSRTATDHPGVFHALALDDATDQLVHLHAYHNIVSGDSLVKSYRFPVEPWLLNQTRTLMGVRVPPAAAELVLFVLRIALKHVSPVEIWKVKKQYQDVSAELAWLREATEIDEAEAALACYFPTIEPTLFRRLVEAIAEGSALWRRVGLGWRVAWRLRHRRRLGTWQAMASRIWRIGSSVVGRLEKRRDLTPLTGGAIVALVGPKATGKSTLCDELAIRLGRHLSVLRIHAGKPPPTLLSSVPRLFIPIARILFPEERSGKYEEAERRRTKSYSLIHVVRAALLAHDRRRLLTRALRMASSGTIVISDRYPSGTVGAIDSSCFDEDVLANCDSTLKRWFMANERRCSADQPQPQLVLRLVAPMARAIERDATRDKADEPDSEAVRRRWDLETRAEFPGVPVAVIDTDRPLEETVRDAVQAVWSVI